MFIRRRFSVQLFHDNSKKTLQFLLREFYANFTSARSSCGGHFVKIHCRIEPTGGGGISYKEYTGVCHEFGSYFQEKIPKRVCLFFTKIPKRAIISVRNSR